MAIYPVIAINSVNATIVSKRYAKYNRIYSEFRKFIYFEFKSDNNTLMVPTYIFLTSKS